MSNELGVPLGSELASSSVGEEAEGMSESILGRVGIWYS